MQPDEMFMKVVQKLQREGLLNTRRKVRFEYAQDNNAIENSVAKKTGVDKRDVLAGYEEYANATAMGSMSDYLSRTPPAKVSFSASLFKAYFPIGRSGTVEVIFDTTYLGPDDKVTEKNKKKIEKIMSELRGECSHS